jgi:hypothetical protein
MGHYVDLDLVLVPITMYSPVLQAHEFIPPQSRVTVAIDPLEPMSLYLLPSSSHNQSQRFCNPVINAEKRYVSTLKPSCHPLLISCCIHIGLYVLLLSATGFRPGDGPIGIVCQALRFRIEVRRVDVCGRAASWSGAI